jgi:hypothetical protein
MEAPSEVWRTLADYPEYEVSDLGRVRNAKKKTLRIPDLNSKGYARHRLVREGKIIRKFVHRLVADAFLTNPENKQMVDHINGDHTDNRLVNLRWTTRSENMLNGKVRKDKKHTTLRNIVKNGNWFRWKVCVGGRIHTSGNFQTEQEAYADFLVHCGELSAYIRLHPQGAVALSG